MAHGPPQGTRHIKMTVPPGPDTPDQTVEPNTSTSDSKDGGSDGIQAVGWMSVSLNSHSHPPSPHMLYIRGGTVLYIVLLPLVICQ